MHTDQNETEKVEKISYVTQRNMFCPRVAEYEEFEMNLKTEAETLYSFWQKLIFLWLLGGFLALHVFLWFLKLPSF